MKRKDIKDREEWERGNPYELPKDFFGDMQHQVLDRIAKLQSLKEKPPRRRFYRGVAACLAIIIATFLFYNTHDTASPSAKNIIDQQIALSDLKPKINEVLPKTTETKINRNLEISNHRFNFAQNSVSKSRRNVNNTYKSRYNKAKPLEIADREFESALNKLNAQELEEQSKKYEIDTYLDLY
ncbi:hypothetical protein GNY06_05490 [Elizabethkingia argentiflava]|uniref:Uncharacterized protein n=1 Tax=Elizabethkingia argenteiflava TaxID=2681556 RepID=A0A845PVE8_9FLAO|nr:hypothetical protein [Elizabethkingia argenteiflava]NAW50846.1 hypothetical protein [Elizabethkingia argenteiflava]